MPLRDYKELNRMPFDRVDIKDLPASWYVTFVIITETLPSKTLHIHNALR
jgi:hypothetical protein